jgi:hypothetical protein
MTFFRIIIPLFAVFVLLACSAGKEQVEVDTPVVRVDTIAPPVLDTRVFKYNERYFVRGALLAKATNIDDPVQALRVIQLVRGAHDALIISSFEKEYDVPTETWLGIEFKTMRPGSYSLQQAEALQFYRFYLGDVRERFDGEKATGTLIIEEMTDEAIIGHINAEIKGVLKSFEDDPRPGTREFSGSFRVNRVDIEDTMIGGR